MFGDMPLRRLLIPILSLGFWVFARANVLSPTDGQILARPYAVQVSLFNFVPRVDELPIPRMQPSPEYPLEMRRALMSAAVNVRVYLKADGSVKSVAIIRNTEVGNNGKLFAEAVEAAVRKWSYRKPAMGADNKSTEIALDYEILFTIP